MQLSTARQCNDHMEEENLAAQGKKQIFNTPRRVFGDKKNTPTTCKEALKMPYKNIQKPTLQIVDPNVVETSTTHGYNSLKYSTHRRPMSVKLNESDDCMEQCNLEEDSSFAEQLQHQNTAILEDSDHEAEFWQKLMSTSNLCTIEEDDKIEFCGPEDESDDYSDIYNPVETNVELTDVPNFVYKKPDYAGYDYSLNHYTLEEMEKLFESYSDILIV